MAIRRNLGCCCSTPGPSTSGLVRWAAPVDCPGPQSCTLGPVDADWRWAVPFWTVLGFLDRPRRALRRPHVIPPVESTCDAAWRARHQLASVSGRRRPWPGLGISWATGVKASREPAFAFGPPSPRPSLERRPCAPMSVSSALPGALRDALRDALTRLLRGYSALPISSPVVDPLATALAPHREPTLDGREESLDVGDVR